jgi:hypothetical protein
MKQVLWNFVKSHTDMRRGFKIENQQNMQDFGFVFVGS